MTYKLGLGIFFVLLPAEKHCCEFQNKRQATIKAKENAFNYNFIIFNYSLFLTR